MYDKYEVKYNEIAWGKKKVFNNLPREAVKMLFICKDI